MICNGVRSRLALKPRWGPAREGGGRSFRLVAVSTALTWDSGTGPVQTGPQFGSKFVPRSLAYQASKPRPTGKNQRSEGGQAPMKRGLRDFPIPRAKLEPWRSFRFARALTMRWRERFPVRAHLMIQRRQARVTFSAAAAAYEGTARFRPRRECTRRKTTMGRVTTGEGRRIEDVTRRVA